MRLVLVDNYSRCILGDTAGFASGLADWRGAVATGADDDAGLSLLAARLLDEHIGEYEWTYEFSRDKTCEVSIGYLIFRPRSDALPLLEDAWGAETLALLAETCDYVGFVRCEAAPGTSGRVEARA
jgi:hypothetical protein